jgi:hypothetical protein
LVIFDLLVILFDPVRARRLANVEEGTKSTIKDRQINNEVVASRGDHDDSFSLRSDCGGCVCGRQFDDNADPGADTERL